MKLEPLQPPQTESTVRSPQHILAGALYGFLTGSAFVISGTLVDRLLHPDLPLGMDWPLFTTRAVWVVLGLMLIGAITSLFTETLPGLLSGAVVAGFVAMVSALVSASTTLGLKILVLIFTLVPMAALSLPVTLILRWLVDKHDHALQSRRIAQIAFLVLLAVFLGAGSGYFLKMSRRALDATRYMQQSLQTAPQNANNLIHDLPGFQSHAGMKYELFQTASRSSTEGFDVRAEYKDGYTVNCVVVVYPGSAPYLSDCTSSSK
jgi:hypothetical protein